MTKSIPLTKGKLALVDDEDYEYLSSKTWNYLFGGYARSGTGELMHRVIMGNPKGVMIDHVNGDKLDNRRSNLRLATRSENFANGIVSKRNKSGCKGVCWSRQMNKWDVRIKVNRKQIFLGLRDDLEEAKTLYREEHIKRFGEYSIFNKE